MSWNEYKGYIASSASVCTIFQFLSGSLICWKFTKRGTTGEISSLPFVVGCLSCSLWLTYGILLEDLSLIIVNMLGALLQLSYVIIFYIYCTRRILVIQQMVAVLLVLVLATLYTKYEYDMEVAKFRVGMLCCVMTIFFFAAPFTQLAHVVRTKNAESLPFWMIVCTVIVCLQWLLYGILLEDLFIQIPNAIGLMLGTIQLSLFVIYPGHHGDR